MLKRERQLAALVGRNEVGLSFTGVLILVDTYRYRKLWAQHLRSRPPAHAGTPEPALRAPIDRAVALEVELARCG